jgi:hypothetical protein
MHYTDVVRVLGSIDATAEVSGSFCIDVERPAKEFHFRVRLPDLEQSSEDVANIGLAFGAHARVELPLSVSVSFEANDLRYSLDLKGHSGLLTYIYCHVYARSYLGSADTLWDKAHPSDRISIPSAFEPGPYKGGDQRKYKCMDGWAQEFRTRMHSDQKRFLSFTRQALDSSIRTKARLARQYGLAWSYRGGVRSTSHR